jgi:hypothetical protein
LRRAVAGDEMARFPPPLLLDDEAFAAFADPFGAEARQQDVVLPRPVNRDRVVATSKEGSDGCRGRAQRLLVTLPNRWAGRRAEPTLGSSAGE